MIEAKRQSNDLATQKNRSDDNIRLENQPSPELNAIYKDKNTPEILMEAENFSQRLKLQQKQFGIKDEDLSVDVQEGYKQIEILDNLFEIDTVLFTITNLLCYILFLLWLLFGCSRASFKDILAFFPNKNG